MSTTLDTTNDNLSDSTPAAPASAQNGKWQADAPGTDPRNISVYHPYATPTVAGLVPTPPNDATKYLDGTANWSKPPNTAINFADNETVTASGTSATLAHTPNPSGSLILAVDG